MPLEILGQGKPIRVIDLGWVTSGGFDGQHVPLQRLEHKAENDDYLEHGNKPGRFE
ncbi:MAG: hypothetical protein GYA17_05190 [Chloroflexi bacterium]|nr:hypothetical protein [Anaerolineaceae bacterium]NMB87730.1 hypothetical protein [Chloroflexota bacterium]